MLFYFTLIEDESDKDKFERLYLNYRQTMFYAANRILHDTHLAEDAVHQAFLRVIDHLDKINENDCHKTRAFLVVIVEHISIDLYRKRKKENWSSYEELDIYMKSNANTYEENDVIQTILELPVPYSVILRLKYSHGYKDREIAGILHISEDNVRQRTVRAKKKLRELLKEKGVVEWLEI